MREGKRLLKLASHEDVVVSYRILGDCPADKDNYYEIEWKYKSGRTATTCFPKANVGQLSRLRTH